MHFAQIVKRSDIFSEKVLTAIIVGGKIETVRKTNTEGDTTMRNKANEERTMKQWEALFLTQPDGEESAEEVMEYKYEIGDIVKLNDVTDFVDDEVTAEELEKGFRVIDIYGSEYDAWYTIYSDEIGVEYDVPESELR